MFRKLKGYWNNHDKFLNDFLGKRPHFKPTPSYNHLTEKLLEAVKHGNLPVVRLLVQKRADIYAADGQKMRHRDDIIGYIYLEDKRGDIQTTHNRAVCCAASYGHLRVVRFLLNPRKYGVNMDGFDWKTLEPKVLAQIQCLKQQEKQRREQQELYQNARVMYYASVFAQRNNYTKGSCGALIQALDMNL